MNKFKFFIVIFLAAILQVTFLKKIKLYNTQPDLLLIVVVYFGLFHGFRLGFLSGLFCGFLEDIFSYNFLGVNTFLFGLTGLVMGFLSGQLYKHNIFMQALLVFITCTVISFFFNFGLFWLLMILPGSFYTAAAAPLVILILDRLFKRQSL